MIRSTWLKFKNWLANKNLYVRTPVKVQKPVVRGKVAVFESRDLEIDLEQKWAEEAEKNSLPYPVDKL